MAERLFQRFGHHYILVMMIVTRVFGSVGGLLVIYYTELALDLPHDVRTHFRVSSLVVVAVACMLTVLLALRETRALRRVIRDLDDGRAVDPGPALQAGREAVLFAGRHHRQEAWLVPCSTLIPVLIYLKLAVGISGEVAMNITIAVFMGVAMALMGTFFVVEHSMRPVTRRLLAAGLPIDYRALPPGRLQFRFRVSFTLIIMTTALMIGTLARQRATDILHQRAPGAAALAVQELRNHSTYITLAAVIVGVVYSTVLAKSVSHRAAELVQAMDRVRAGNLSERVHPTGNDEIDVLARQFNAMVGHLEHNDHTIRDLNANLEQKVRERTRQLEQVLDDLRRAQSQLTDVAHRAGMAEIATGVLHNVGNVLNSVNISTTVLHDRLERSLLDDLQRLAERLAGQGERLGEFLSQEGRGPKMIEYLSTLCQRLGDDRKTLRHEVAALTDNVGHIRNIISAQQSYARCVRFKEQVDLAVLIRDVLQIHALSCSRHQIEVRTEIADIPVAWLEKSKLVQVIDNLVKNAVESLRSGAAAAHDQNEADGLPGEAGGFGRIGQRQLTVRLLSPQPDWAQIEVIDNGLGIAAEHVPSLFTYGFTTKPDGNGFGLHASALALSEIGGRIGAHSDGPGQGAQFVIDIPLETADEELHDPASREPWETAAAAGEDAAALANDAAPEPEPAICVN